ncbi:MAG: hypothetical protein JWR69_232 [Pedosphaera sp.]|nr:hypothetical protein [Pedosphaera sp.]
MKPLQPPSTHQVRAAQGWFELGNHREATAELDAIPTALRAHPDVLEVRLSIYAQAQKWEQCVYIAEALVVLAPNRPGGWIHRSHALHGLRRTDEALQALLPAVKKFPNLPTIPYNLACYACQRGNLENARGWLKMAFRLADTRKCKLMALEDSDLKALWAEIGNITPNRIKPAGSAPIRSARRIPNVS